MVNFYGEVGCSGAHEVRFVGRTAALQVPRLRQHAEVKFIVRIDEAKLIAKLGRSEPLCVLKRRRGLEREH